MKLIDYIKGTRRGKDANRIERDAMTDPFLSEAIEGYDAVYGNHTDELNSLSEKIERLGQKRRRAVSKMQYTIWGVVAAVVILVAVFVVISPSGDEARVERAEKHKFKEVAADGNTSSRAKGGSAENTTLSAGGNSAGGDAKSAGSGAAGQGAAGDSGAKTAKPVTGGDAVESSESVRGRESGATTKTNNGSSGSVGRGAESKQSEQSDVAVGQNVTEKETECDELGLQNDKTVDAEVGKQAGEVAERGAQGEALVKKEASAKNEQTAVSGSEKNDIKTDGSRKNKKDKKAKKNKKDASTADDATEKELSVAEAGAEGGNGGVTNGGGAKSGNGGVANANGSVSAVDGESAVAVVAEPKVLPAPIPRDRAEGDDAVSAQAEPAQVDVAQEVELVTNEKFEQYFAKNHTTFIDDNGEELHGKVVAEFRVNQKGWPSAIVITSSFKREAGREVIDMLSKTQIWTPTGERRVKIVVEY